MCLDTHLCLNSGAWWYMKANPFRKLLGYFWLLPCELNLPCCLFGLLLTWLFVQLYPDSIPACYIWCATWFASLTPVAWPMHVEFEPATCKYLQTKHLAPMLLCVLTLCHYSRGVWLKLWSPLAISTSYQLWGLKTQATLIICKHYHCLRMSNVVAASIC